MMRRLVSMPGAALLVMALGCREEVTSPTDPEPTAALATASTPLSFRQISAGGYHSCGVTTENRAYCWGANIGGALGDGTTTDRSRPVAVAGGLRFHLVSVGIFYTCGVTTDDRAYCWGSNGYGQLGDGTSNPRLTPVAVVGGHYFREVRAGNLHTCGVTKSDEAFCWGFNRYGQVGDGSGLNRRLKPVRVAGGLLFRQVIAGGLHTCGATTDFRAFCWGYGSSGQIGDGKTYQRNTPRAVSGGLRFRQVHAALGSWSCGVTTLDKAYCWGNNFDGHLGDGTTTGRLTPVAVAGSLNFSGVSPGATHSCGVTKGGVGKCWGENFSGQLGDGTTTRRLRPFTVSGGLDFATNGISSRGSGSHSCGVTTGIRAYCWGSNFRNQLGDGTSTDRLTPVAVVGP